jgi:sRNA-binding regulator protein Hfq
MSSERPIAQADLETLAQPIFGKLGDAEVKLLRAVAKGQWAVCGPNQKDDDPANDPSRSQQWGVEREVRADVIRWLFVNSDCAEKVDPKGIRVHGAKIKGMLDLSYVSSTFPLVLRHCRLLENANFRCVELPELVLQGSWVRSVMAGGAKIKGTVALDRGFRAEGEVKLITAEISGDLGCENAKIVNPAVKGNDESGVALNVERATIGGTVFLRNGFCAEGAVRTLNAQIGGDLDCGKATLKNAIQQGLNRTGEALNAERTTVGGSVFLRDGFAAEGQVRLMNTQIRGNLVFGKATLKNPREAAIKGSGEALDASRVNVGGDLTLGGSFQAQGRVLLAGAHVGGNVQCSSAIFANPLDVGAAENVPAFDAASAEVKGSFSLTDGFHATGPVRLVGMQVGGVLPSRLRRK